MKVIGISGSPRKKGNTSYLINEVLGEVNKLGIDTQMIELSDYTIADCCGCEGCKYTYKCVIKDDMQNLYLHILEADALILGSPTYFYDVTAITKAFLDRLYCYEVFDEEDRSVWMSVNEAMGSKLASVISVCEQKDDRDTGHAALTMQLTLQSLGYRITDCTKIIKLYRRGEAQRDPQAVFQARENGIRLGKTLLLKHKIRNIEQVNVKML